MNMFVKIIEKEGYSMNQIENLNVASMQSEAEISNPKI